MRCIVLTAFAVSGALVGSSMAAPFADFEGGTAPGFGALTSSSGVQPWASPVAGAVVTAGPSGLSGSKVLEITGNAAFNFGQSGGGALGLDFLSAGLRSAFLANTRLEFDWVAVPTGATAGYSQLYSIYLNSQGGGFTTVSGYGASPSDPNCNQYYYGGYSGATHHIVVDYSTYKNTVLGSANPDGGGWLQLGIALNAGGGAPADMYFDNFALTSVPEPASLALIGIPMLQMLRRRVR